MINVFQVPRTLPCWTACESACVIPEIAQVLCAQCSQASTTKGTKEEVNVI